MSTLTSQYGELTVNLLIGIITALVLGPLAVWLARRFNLIDIPGHSAHKLHSCPTPLAGGIILASSIFTLIPLLGLWQHTIANVLISCTIIFLFGWWDDAKGLTAYKKIFGQLLASILLISSDYSVRFLNNMNTSLLNSHLGTILNWGITIIWFIGITNAFNLIDSMDGLAIGVAGISFVSFMIMAAISHQTSLAIFNAILAGICIGIFIYNRNPARLFLGDAGALSLGFILAAIATAYKPIGIDLKDSSWFLPIIVLGYPIFDTTLVIISRIRGHRPIYTADRTHTYHRLIVLGLQPKQAVLLIHTISLLLGFLGIYALSHRPAISYIIFGVLICVGLAAIIYLENFQLISNLNEKNKNS